MIYFLAFFTGFLGSMHCVGMCGPIALALPVGHLSTFKAYWARVVYQFGRTWAYAIIGLIPGLLGEAISLTGFQQKLSVLAGFGLLIAAFAPRFLHIESNFSVILQIKKRLLKVWIQKKTGTFLFAGVLNGFLPCGFVYIGLAGSLSAGSLTGSMLYMLAFGLGTWPAILGISWVWGWANQPFRTQILRFAPAFTFILGLLFIVRGLNLQIPNLSPAELEVNGKKEIVCCKKPSSR